MLKGIDISKWQKNVDYKKVAAAGINFAILRAGRRREIDEMFLEHVRGCEAANIPIMGVYHFSYALTVSDAVKEARACMEFVERAGLGKGIIIFYDFEYDTVESAAKKGVRLKKEQCVEFTRAFCQTIAAAGYRAGIYMNNDYRRNMYTKDLIDKYILWLADYTGGPDYPCLIQQYTSSGKVPGLSGGIDLNYYFGEEKLAQDEEEFPHWVHVGNLWYYRLEKGVNAHGWRKINGRWYFFDGNGKMLTGWQNIDGKKYFLETTGDYEGACYITDEKGAQRIMEE